MIKQIFNEQELPMDDLEKIGLAKNGVLNLDEDDLKALLSGRRTAMLKLENLELDGAKIDSLDAKISIIQNADGKHELKVHPIYLKAEYPPYLTDTEAQKLQKNGAINLEKFIFDDEGNPRDVLIEYDKETNEFIVTDTENILAPDFMNNEPLTKEQKERYRKGKEVEISDGSTFQYSGTDPNGIRSDKLALVASVLIDGGISYMLYKGLHALFGKKQDEQKAERMSDGYYKAWQAMQKQEQQPRYGFKDHPENQYNGEFSETISR